MFMVLFDVCPHSDQMHQYLEFAGLLRPEIEQIQGFIHNERFSDISHPERLLSLSTWMNEKALIRWRTHAQHHDFQGRARSFVFTDYRLRVGELIADSASAAELPQQRFDATETDPVKAIVVLEVQPAGDADPLADHVLRTAAIDPQHPPAGWVERSQFTSIYNTGKHALLSGWTSAEAAFAWHNTHIAPLSHPGLRSRFVRVIRSYGMHNRGEAPQYYPEAVAETAIW